MLGKKISTFAIAVLVAFAAVPAAHAGEIEQAHATVAAIERDRMAAHNEASYFYGEMNRVQERLRWHAWMEQVRNDEMNQAGCARPATQPQYAYCMGLYNDLQAHERWRQHLSALAQEAQARHMAAVQHLGDIDRAGHVWRTRLAELMVDGNRLAAVPETGSRIETGSVDGARWSRVVR